MRERDFLLACKSMLRRLESETEIVTTELQKLYAYRCVPVFDFFDSSFRWVRVTRPGGRASEPYRREIVRGALLDWLDYLDGEPCETKLTIQRLEQIEALSATFGLAAKCALVGGLYVELFEDDLFPGHREIFAMKYGDSLPKRKPETMTTRCWFYDAVALHFGDGKRSNDTCENLFGKAKGYLLERGSDPGRAEKEESESAESREKQKALDYKNNGDEQWGRSWADIEKAANEGIIAYHKTAIVDYAKATGQSIKPAKRGRQSGD